jgi:hypothetical protein
MQRLAGWDPETGSLTQNPASWRDKNAYGWFMHGHPGFKWDGPVIVEPWVVGDNVPAPPAG